MPRNHIAHYEIKKKEGMYNTGHNAMLSPSLT